MGVVLAPIRSIDLQTGDVLIATRGGRWRLRSRGQWDDAGHGWHVDNIDAIWATGFISDADINRAGPHRLWWLDETGPR